MGFWDLFNFKKRDFTDHYAPFTQANFFNENAGQIVSSVTAMQVPPYASAINLLSTSLAKLTIHVEKAGKSIEEHPIKRLLENPSEFLDSYTLFQQAEMNRLNEGNAYVYIQRDKTGNADNLLLINPSFVNIMIEKGGYYYQVTNNGSSFDVLPKDMIHVKSPVLDMNSLKGLGYYKILERQIGLWLAAQSHQNNYFALGSNPNSIIETPEKLSPEKRKMVREAWEKLNGGSTNRHRVAVVDAGMKYQKMGFNFQELEMNVLFDNMTKQIASVFNVAPYMLGHEGTGNTYTNVETQNMNFLQQALMPSIVAWEHQLKKLFVKDDGYRAKFNYETLLRADSKTRAERIKTLVDAKVMTEDEGRQYEGLPQKGGNEE